MTAKQGRRLKDSERKLSQDEIDEFAQMTEEEKMLLIKVQAKLRGWVLRNKNKKRMLEEAREAGGAYSIFELPMTDKLVRCCFCCRSFVFRRRSFIGFISRHAKKSCLRPLPIKKKEEEKENTSKLGRPPTHLPGKSS